MAVAEMKKLRLLMLRSKRDELLRELICRGCVEFSRIDESVKANGVDVLLHKESSKRSELEASYERLVKAVELLEKNAPAMKRVHLRKPEQEDHALLDDTGLNFALRKAGEVLALEERISFAHAEQERLQKLVEELRPWMGLDVPLNPGNMEQCSLLVGSVPASVDVEKLAAELEETDERSELFYIKEEKKLKFVALLCMNEQLEKMREKLGTKGFKSAPRPESSGSAMQCASDAQARIKEHAREEEHCRELLSEEIIHRDGLRLAADRVKVKIALAEAEECLYGTESTLLMEGWFPAEREAELEKLFDRFGCAYEISEPESEEYPNVPVQIKSAGAGEKYGLPCYGSTSPGPLTALFFTLFLSLLTADVGLGFVMCIAALLGTIKKKEKSLNCMLSFAGLGAIALGIARGAYFGTALEHLLSLYYAEAPYVFPGAKVSLPVYWQLLLYGLAALLLCHLVLALLIALIKRIRRGHGGLIEFAALRRWLGDVLMLCRLCALSLGGVVIAAAFLHLDLMTENIILSTASFALGLIMAFVSVLLDCRSAGLSFKWFSQLKLMLREGRAFRPLEIRTKYNKRAE